MSVTEADRGAVTATLATSVASLTFGHAAQQLGLRRGEFDLAVQLGHIRSTPGVGGGRRRVTRDEIGRLQLLKGFPDALRERVRTVGTADAAGLIGVGPARFTRLARAGCFTPVRFWLNRYRAVVWMYLAEEVREFAAREPELLTGRTPEVLRERLAAGEDWRARNWRGRRLGLLLRLAEDPWARAAVAAGALDPVQLAEVVDDPCERAYLSRLRPPEPVRELPDSPVAREVVERLLSADDPDEILWHRGSLILALDEARADRPAPRPEGSGRGAAAMTRSAEEGRARGLPARCGPGPRNGRRPGASHRGLTGRPEARDGRRPSLLDDHHFPSPLPASTPESVTTPG
ncbi:DUF6397 family protein [Streptomyces sp. NBC_01500]|uniref:DUF6397 family protein n=1 Tax=Streptomyces sp. NBC_01500 TaxID=2903886 RepID=UPI00224D59BA|nr:DUF6397 family protein [Streptomyces sp. NBC_01500]MCX4553397.1 DUF6397 family protein [Streptomyces sp. NBC_01500]